MKLFDIKQRSSIWFEVRRGIPTASAANKIITGLGRPSGQASFYAAKLVGDRLGLPQCSISTSEAMRRGVDLEPEARRMFERHLRIAVKEVGFVLSDDLNAGCSPDGLLVDDFKKPLAGLEIKCPLRHNHEEVLRKGEVPTIYKPQIHASMAITGLRAWWFVSYCPNSKPYISKVLWDSYTDRVYKALEMFVRRLEQESRRRGVPSNWRTWRMTTQ